MKVRADHTIDGKTCPLLFREADGPICRIDRILDMRQAAALKAGGQGIRYVCEVEGRVILLYFDDPYWFIECDEPR